MPSAATEPIPFSRMNGENGVRTSDGSAVSEEFTVGSMEQLRPIEMYQPSRPVRVTSSGELQPYIVRKSSDSKLDLSIGDCEGQSTTTTTVCENGVTGLGAENGSITAILTTDAKASVVTASGKTADGDVPTTSFPLLPGEHIKYSGLVQNGTVFVTSYRLFVSFGDNKFCNIPITAIDTVEARDMFVLQIVCKDGRLFKICSENSENSLTWYKVLTQLSASPRKMDEVFAFAFRAWQSANAQCTFLKSLDTYQSRRCPGLERVSSHPVLSESCRSLPEGLRLDFDEKVWRISNANQKFELCETYPRKLLVPMTISDDDLKQGRSGRFLHRFPTIVWRAMETGAVLIRSSQPKVGLFSWRNGADERLLQQTLIATAKQPGYLTHQLQQQKSQLQSGHSEPTAANETVVDDSKLLNCVKSMLILDARSYTAAWANRAKGGGFESAEYYTKTEVQFMGLPNIHNIRYSFQQFRQLLTSQIDQNTYLQSLQTTQWFSYVANLMVAGKRCVDALLDERRSVLVHCSDGWDRTTQIVTLAKLIADPHYRTITGFKELVERDWLEFGHKFADRVGLLNGDPNERSPVFLQWLDCVWQLHTQFPCAFEFNQLYLAKLAQHVYAGLFGTFLSNSPADADKQKVNTRTFSVWQYLHPENGLFRNCIYAPGEHGRLRPDVGVQYLRLWRQVYCCGRFERIPAATFDEGQHSGRARNVSVNTEMDRSLTRAHSCDSLGNATQDNLLGTSPPSNLMPNMTLAGGGGANINVVHYSHSQSVTIVRTGSESNISHEVKSAIDDVVSRVSLDDSTDLPPDEEDGKDFPDALSTNTDFAGTNGDHVPDSGRDTTTTTTTINGNCFAGDNNGRMSTNGRILPVMGSRVTMLEMEGSLTETLVNGYAASEDDNRPAMNTSTTEISDSAVGRSCCQAKRLGGKSSSPVKLTNGLLSVDYSETATKKRAIRRGMINNKAKRKLERIEDVLDDDGLTKIEDREQERFREITLDKERHIAQLELELHRTRKQCRELQNLVNCRRCSSGEQCANGTADHNTFGNSNGSKMSLDDSSVFEPRSFESLSSDLSWDNVDEVVDLPTKWIPDHAVSHCMGCDSRFSQLIRRHHCRSCGKVFCRACTSYESAVPKEQLFEPQRVCDVCYKALDGKFTNATTPQPNHISESMRDAAAQNALLNSQSQAYNNPRPGGQKVAG